MSPETRRFSVRLRRLLWIASALVVGTVVGLFLHFTLGDLPVPRRNPVSGQVAGTSAGTLIDAINVDSLDQVDRLIRLGSNVNARDADLETPLMRAACRGEPLIVERLLSAGSSVTARDKSGRSVMHFAAEGLDESSRIVEVLIAAGTPVDAPDDEGETPLMLAAHRPSVPKLKMLLNNGANPNLANQCGQTPLIYAVCEYTDARNLAERVELLLYHGANPDARTHDGQTALDLASQQLELYSDPEFTGTQKALLTGAEEQLQKMDLDAEMRKTFAEVAKMADEANAAARKNFPIVVQMLRDRTKQPPSEKPGPDL